MKKIGLLVAAFLVFSIGSLGQTGPMVWTKPTGGKNYQLFSIKQPSGEFIGICRAAYQGGVYPGKLVNKKCSIGFEGKEVVLSDFEIFEQDANPNIRIDDSWYKEVGKERFEIGYEKDGKKIFLCKAVYQNTLQPGKSIDGKCVFMWNGTEMATPNYLDYFYETKTAPSAAPTPTPTLTETERAKRAENFFNSAVYNFRGNKFEAAAQDFTEYLKLYPNNANVYFNRGVAYQRAGKNDAAKADFERALQLKPDFPAAKAQLEKLKTTPHSESVSGIAQVKDVKLTDEFYRDLQSLIERYGISALTVNYQYNPKQSLTLLEYTKFIGQAKETLKNAASAFGIKKIDEEKLFNSKCTFSGSYVASIPETEIAKSLSCIFRIEKLEIPATGAMTTRGRFATFLNTALERASLKITLDHQAEDVTGNLFSAQTAQPANSAPQRTGRSF